jgi:hypothetical protein
VININNVKINVNNVYTGSTYSNWSLGIYTILNPAQVDENNLEVKGCTFNMSGGFEGLRWGIFNEKGLYQSTINGLKDPNNTFNGVVSAKEVGYLTTP